MEDKVFDEKMIAIERMLKGTPVEENIRFLATFFAAYAQAAIVDANDVSYAKEYVLETVRIIKKVIDETEEEVY